MHIKTTYIYIILRRHKVESRGIDEGICRELRGQNVLYKNKNKKQNPMCPYVLNSFS